MNAPAGVNQYAYQDFILVRADQVPVAAAVAKHLLSQDRTLAEAAAPEPARPGLGLRLLGWLFPRRVGPLVKAMDRGAAALAEQEDDSGAEPDAPPPFTMHVGAAARPGELLVSQGIPVFAPAGMGLDDHDPAAEEVRVSVPREAPDWVLVEFVETISGLSLMGGGLSGHLPGCDVLYFRRSGDQARGRRYDFHLYRDQDILRRVLCHATWPEDDPAQEWWEGSLDGALTDYEPPEMYHGATDATVLDNAGISAILGRIGLDEDMLFAPGATEDAILFSRKPGGAPIT